MVNKKINILLVKYFFYISLSLTFLNISLAKDVDIQEDISLSFKCDLIKKILKNSEYNYKTFLAKDTDDKDLNKFDIEAKNQIHFSLTDYLYFYQMLEN